MSDSDPVSEDADELVVERLPPDQAFGLVAHETRFRILEALNDATDSLAFSGLRERVDVDDPGQFNYHLGKLTDRFVRDTESGYELTPSGHRVVGAVLSGGYTKVLNADPVGMDASCLLCGSEMEIRFRAEGVDIWCGDCEFSYTDITVPAGILEGVTPEEAPAVVDRWLKRIQSTADYGFCYNCDGRLEQAVRIEGEEQAPDWLAEDGPDELEGDAPETTVEYECRRCGRSWHTSVMFAVVLHPAVVGFHHDHGVDVRETPWWDLDWLEIGASALVGREPVRIDVTVTVGDGTAVFTFDRDLNVVAERRK